jgi:glycogen phosphorylase
VRPIRTFAVSPRLPTGLERLLDLANNVYWSWHDDATDLFARIDFDLWESCHHNPVRMLGLVSQKRLDRLATDDGFLAHLKRVIQNFDDYMASQATWYRREHRDVETRIAYFSLEFGLTEALPLYSGGMGILAGDHLKSASDLGLPMVAVGLAYQEGYFRQYLNADGWQGETYPDNDFFTMPMELVRNDDGSPIRISVDYPGRALHAQVWRIQVGRIPLFLLDANLDENSPHDRLITDRLYGGDVDMRIRQEILLGMGGLRVLEAMGKRPNVCHMNEGHAAFLGVERIRQSVVAHGLSFAEAREATSSGNVFTTHTPVPAGIDVFSPELIDHYFGHLYPQLGVSREEFLSLGRQNPDDQGEYFSMAVLAIRLASHVNGVSKLHGEVSRRMWQGVWPDLPLQEVPIGSITNGVHTLTWVSGHDMVELFDRYLGTRWREDPTDSATWSRVRAIPSEELWRTHEHARERLIVYARNQVRRQREQRGATASDIGQANDVLLPDALTIGFARRFAAYKRALLLFREPERLGRILNNRERRVQIIVAGKAHPQDIAGREIIRQLIHNVREHELERQIVFLEDYNIELARYLVQGVDVWLTTPRRPLEASGTSGMKVAMNGGLNLSVLDGWWCEAYNPNVGWAIGRGEEYEDQEYQDQIESRALYDLLEKEVIPMFYDRGHDDLPREWIERMKSSIAEVTPAFNTHRMVRDYVNTAYVPSARRFHELASDNLAGAKSLAHWREDIRRRWPWLRVDSVETTTPDKLQVGAEVQVTTRVQLGPVKPEEVRVELLYGVVDGTGQLGDETAKVDAQFLGSDGDTALFRGTIPCDSSGLWGYAVRVQPHHASMNGTIEPGLVRWAK